MSSHLDRIGDWEAMAKEAHYDAAQLAARCRVTQRHLRRYFAAQFGLSLHAWLDAQKLLESIGWLQQGESVKTVAWKLRYKNASAFCHAFKRAYGMAPLTYLAAKTGKSRCSRCNGKDFDPEI